MCKTNEDSLLFPQQTDKSEMLDEQQRDILSAGGTPRKVGYYTRNNPHAGKSYYTTCYSYQ